MKARWPTLLGDGAVNEVAIEAAHHLIKVTHEFRVRLKKMLEMKVKGKVSKHLIMQSKALPHSGVYSRLHSRSHHMG